MYPVVSRARIEHSQQPAQWNGDTTLRVLAREADPPTGNVALTKLREFYESHSRAIVTGVAAALLFIPIVTLLAATDIAVSRPLRGLVEWTRSPLIWLSLIAIQLSFVIVFLAEDRRRRRADATLRESEESMAIAAASANIGLWNWDLGNDKIRASDLCREVLGMRPGAQCSLRQFFDVVHSEDRGILRRAIDDALATGKKFEVELRVVLRERGVRWITASGRTRYSNAQRAVGLTGVFVDITDRKTAEKEAEEQREYVTHLTRVRMIGALSGAVAHELNQPLTAILSNAQAAQRMLSRQTVDIRELRTTIKDIIDDDSRAAQVIRHLRSLLTKSDANFQTVSLTELVIETLELVRAELIERQVRLVVRLDSALPEIKADRIQLQQVILNLILNAADSLMANPSTDRVLTVSAASDGESIELVCQDNGPGIPPDSLERLFEAFYTTKKHGLGLGLLISRAIVTTHGGNLWATNNPGGGASFHMKLPVLKAGHG
jgi:PAS domain S-box-containing protein